VEVESRYRSASELSTSGRPYKTDLLRKGRSKNPFRKKVYQKQTFSKSSIKKRGSEIVSTKREEEKMKKKHPEHAKMKPLEKIGHLLADGIVALGKPISRFGDWAARQVEKAERGMKIRRDYVVILIVILAIIILGLAIPILDALLRAPKPG